MPCSGRGPLAPSTSLARRLAPPGDDFLERPDSGTLADYSSVFATAKGMKPIPLPQLLGQLAKALL